MSISQLKGSVVDAKLWLPIDEVESEALDQIRAMCNIPQIRNVAIMPDVHSGRGSVVGSVSALKDAIAPSWCGSDIGCGMIVVKTNLKETDLGDLKAVRNQIERDVPVGFNCHKEVDKIVKSQESLWEDFCRLTPEVQKLFGKAQLQLGTMGSGNHMCEVTIDNDHNVWILLHSGSRNIGKVLADIHIKIAKSLSYNQSGPTSGDNALLLQGTPEFDSYWHDLQWAQLYAKLNREDMIRRIHKGLSHKLFPDLKVLQSISCHHNYATKETWNGEEVIVTRKGAIRVQLGELGIIPGSMATASYIVKGLGNPESLCSASHGAGRRMSRSKAKKTFTQVDIDSQLQGVECRHDLGILDELPGSYKAIEDVMNNQKDLVIPIVELYQVVCIKG